MIIGVLVVELVSVVAVVAVVVAGGGVAAAGAGVVFTFTAGVIFAFAAPVAGFAAAVAVVVGVANGFCPALATAEGARIRASSARTAHAHAAGRSLIGRAELIGMDVRISSSSERRA
jgi:hypothetical protein